MSSSDKNTSIKLTQGWINKNGEKLKKAYSIAVSNKCDINSPEQVLEILKTTDPENANQDYAEIFSKMLQLFELKLAQTLGKRQKSKKVN